MKTIRHARLAVILALLCGMASLAHAQAPASQKITVNIEAQPMEQALNAFAEQAGLQLLVRADAVAKGIVAPRLVGTYTAQDALEKLLANTPLNFKFIDARTVAIRAVKSEGAVVPEKTSAAQDAGPALRLARVGQAPPAAATAEADSAQADVRGVPEILVKGKRSTNTDIRRTEDDPQPYVVFDGEEIQRSQAVNLEDFLAKRLPMNAAQDPPSQSTTSSATLAISAINLRGLGESQTLILVDGRRLPGVAVFGNPLQSDINGIPLAAVERIEVLPSTAGGIYGGSATGGVINIIMRKDYAGLEANATYANTFDTDSGSVRLDANAGFSLENGRTQVMVTATHSQSNTMVMGDRDFAERGVALQRKNYPAAIGSGVPLGATVNIQSALVVAGVRQPLRLDSQYGGALLGSTFTHLPLGYAGPGSDSGAALVANAGSYNLDLPAGLAGRDRGMLAAPSTLSASINARREFSSKIEAFVEFSRFGSDGSAANAGAPFAVSNMPADAPNNPFQQPINIRFPTPGLSFQSVSESTTLRATGGLIVRLPHEWTAETDLAWNRSRIKLTGANVLVDDVTATVLRTGLPAPDGRPALDALRESNTFPIDFTPYLLPMPAQVFGPYDTEMKDATLRLSGPALRLPAGQLWLSALIEKRQEEILDAFSSSIDSATRELTYEYVPYRSQDVDSIYLEARAPLLRQVEAQLSVRRDEYSTHAGNFGLGVPISSPDDPLPQFDYRTNEFSSTDYTLGLRYAPSEDVALRMSFGTGFLPPSVMQIVPGSFDFNSSFGLLDPKRGLTDTYVDVPFEYIYGGNPDLRPEQSESWSAGVILTPRFAQGLRVSVDYTRIEKIDEIGSPDLQFLLNNEDELPGRITRGPKLSTDPASWAGPITAFNLGYINIAKTQLEAFDVQADYVVDAGDAGEFRWYAMATRTPHYVKQALPTSPELENAGYLSAPLKWRGNFGLDWTRGPLSLGWNAQYFSSHIGYWAETDEFSREYFRRSQGGSATIESQMYHDLILGYRMGGEVGGFAGGIFANTRISLGIQNVLNTLPPILAITGPVNGRAYSGFGDPRLRRYTLSVRKSFQ